MPRGLPNGRDHWGTVLSLSRRSGGLNSALRDKRIWTGREGIPRGLEDLTKRSCNICHSTRMCWLSFEPW